MKETFNSINLEKFDFSPEKAKRFKEEIVKKTEYLRGQREMIMDWYDDRVDALCEVDNIEGENEFTGETLASLRQQRDYMLGLLQSKLIWEIKMLIVKNAKRR